MNETPYEIAEQLDRMQSPKLRAIAERCLVNLSDLIASREDRIQRALQEIDEGAKLTLSHSISIDLGGNKMVNKLSFAIKDSDEIAEVIPDPEQPELPFTVEVMP